MFPDLFSKCACFGEGMRLVYTGDGEFYVSMWKDRGSNKTCWRQRFRHIWRILTKGEPWDDEIVLHMDEAKRLAQFIVEQEAP
jgi:hypothetical protein